MDQKTLFKAIVFLVLVLISTACRGRSEDVSQPTSSDTHSSPLPASSELTLVPNTNFSSSNEDIVSVAPQTLAAGQGTLTLNVTMPVGYKFNNIAPFTMSLNASGSVHFDDTWRDYRQVDPPMPLEIPLTLTEGAGWVDMGLTIYWCEAIRQTLCFVEHRQVNVPLNIQADSMNEVASVDLSLTSPE